MSELSLSEFADRVSELMPVIMKEFMKHQTEEFYKMKITMPQFFVMEYLLRCGGCKMGEIAKYINVTTAAMTGLVDRIVRDGYAARSSDPDDRRIVNIKLTPKGSRLVKDMMERRKQVSMNMFSRISHEEREQYLKILTHIKEAMQEQG